jgi:hypothetical protein
MIHMGSVKVKVTALLTESSLESVGRVLADAIPAV